MDYEKKYKNALEWAIHVMNGKTGFIRKEMEKIFPELKENEDDDEKIRKEIIDFIKKRNRSGCDYDYDKWIAWLEKQRQPIILTEPAQPTQPEKNDKIRKALIEGLRAMKNNFHTISSIKIDDAIAWLEKQGKLILANSCKTRKDTWSEEDEMNVKRLILYLSCREKITPEVKSRYIDWLKSLKERIK